MIVNMGIFGEVDLDIDMVWLVGQSGSREGGLPMEPDEPESGEIKRVRWNRVDITNALDHEDIAMLEEMLMEYIT
jgi:hypothetical protein